MGFEGQAFGVGGSEGKRFLRLTAPAALKVLRFDGPTGPRVVVGALMDTPFGREG
jgi:hypothetical protein